MPHLLDFPVTIFIVWAGLRVWKESKRMVIDMDTRHLEALREITHKSDLALRRVTDGMRSFREEVRVLKAMTNGIPGLLDVKDRERTAIRKTEGGHSETSNPTNY